MSQAHRIFPRADHIIGQTSKQSLNKLHHKHMCFNNNGTRLEIRNGGKFGKSLNRWNFRQHSPK